MNERDDAKSRESHDSGEKRTRSAPEAPLQLQQGQAQQAYDMTNSWVADQFSDAGSPAGQRHGQQHCNPGTPLTPNPLRQRVEGEAVAPMEQLQQSAADAASLVSSTGMSANLRDLGTAGGPSTLLLHR